MGTKRKKKTAASVNAFKTAVEKTPDVAGGYRVGLQAIESADITAIKVKNTRSVNGSLNIDKETHDLYPNSPRWDYAVSYASKVHYIEVHPASTSNISEMSKKKKWLLEWLCTKAPLLNSLPSGSPRLHWAATEAGIHISKQSSDQRKLAQLGIIPKRPVVLG